MVKGDVNGEDQEGEGVLGRIGCGPPGVSAAPALAAASDPNSGALASSNSRGCTLAGQIKEGGRKNATAVRRLRRRRRMKEMLTGRISMGRRRRRGRNIFRNYDHLKRHEMQMTEYESEVWKEEDNHNHGILQYKSHRHLLREKMRIKMN